MLKNQLLFAEVMHKRLRPRINQFLYKIYYICVPLSQLKNLNNYFLSVNKINLLSFYEKDHGLRDGSSVEKWIRNILKKNNIKIDGEVVLLTYPRVMGYVFNPISIFLCFDKASKLMAVLAEVNNTFGESHNYLIYHSNKREIKKDDWLEAKKMFHVSPFYKVRGKYKFRFAITEKKIGIWINYFTEEGEELKTSVTGNLVPLTNKTCLAAFCQLPLVTIKTIFLIHFQAVKLLIKKIKYIKKPTPPRENITKC